MSLKYVRQDGSVEWIMYDNGGVPIRSVVTDYERRTMDEEWEQLELSASA